MADIIVLLVADVVDVGLLFQAGNSCVNQIPFCRNIIIEKMKKVKL